MRFDKLTTKSQEALADAESRADRANHPEVRPEHLLESLLAQKDGAVPAVIEVTVPPLLSSVPSAKPAGTPVSPAQGMAAALPALAL